MNIAEGWTNWEHAMEDIVRDNWSLKISSRADLYDAWVHREPDFGERVLLHIHNGTRITVWNGDRIRLLMERFDG